MPARRVARILVDSPLPQLDRLFDYAIPDQLAAEAVPGVRVKVPLRSAGRVVEGYLVEMGVDDPADRPLSDVEVVVSPVCVLPERLYRLARAVADRAAGGAGDILRLAVPKRMVRAEKAWLAADPPLAPVVSDAARARAQAVLAAYPGLEEGITTDARLALDAPPRTAHLADGPVVGEWAIVLAAGAVASLTEGRSAVIVVPDYRDQEQVLAALASFDIGDAVVRVDARQSGPERYGGYLRILAKAPCVVVGSRSAVYAPAHRVGLVALWDDGDTLLSEPLSPGVHARDAALVRQELEGTALLFAGHTRTTDVQRLVEAGWVRDLAAARRVSPRVILSATREGESRGSRVPSAAFAAAREALQTGPVLVQVARPGFAPTLVCAECRSPARCRHCGGPLRAHRRGAVPECAWCGRAAHGWTCASCGSDRVRMASSGSERTADELGRAFPGTRIIISDGAHPLTRVEARPALVVATRGAEPIADDGYRAVLLLDGDRMLQSDDLRIGESCLRWWSNAAALAAPGAPVHLVGVTGPVARALATWSQPAYARSELAERAPLKMPPTVRIAALEGTAAEVDAALTAVRSAVTDLAVDDVLGPVPVEETHTVRALVRFAYAQGRVVTAALRGAVVTAALRTRRPAKGRPPGPRNTLKVRVDVLDPEL
ncbi:primosomal protein N' [Microbacterium horticulturae]|uniref:Probable replication restart protein PriA n=1 Tax=Microbacterium horticulturae TaxID=3028316 RepID=A0ABY8C230_9MICO|nr:primosomal protein N' [Microbacterium sp. KACC 23027]WEG10524.1 primosomal protein N' [Microbacterium sp. KACC 23027]